MEHIEKTSTAISDILSALRKNRQEVSKKYKAEIKGVFGSHVKDAAGKESDVDVLVAFADNATLLDLVGLSDFLEEQLHCPVDIVPESSLREELRSAVLNETVYL